MLMDMTTSSFISMVIKEGFHYAKLTIPSGEDWSNHSYLVVDPDGNGLGFTTATATPATWYQTGAWSDTSAYQPITIESYLGMEAEVYISADGAWMGVAYPGFALPAEVPALPEPLKIKIYNKVGWSKMNCYAWDPSVADNNWLKAWPGTTMEKDGDWYVLTLDEKYRGKNLSFIFNDGTNQTHNLEFVYMDDTRHFRVDAAKTAVAITPENKDAKPGVTIYVKNTANWSPLKIYSWNDSDQTQSGSWSGTQMTQTEVINGVTYYKYAFNNYDNTKGLHVILNNGSKQTNDICW